MFVAWDIETCPLPVDGYTERQQRRHDLLLRREASRHPDEEEQDLARKVSSLHPSLGWICCISVVGASDPDAPRQPRSYTAATPDAERAMLEEFWADVARLPDRVLWITFYGKDFDAEFLLTRSLRHGILPARQDLLDRYPWRNQPHCDISGLWRKSAMGLADVCELLGVADPKGEMSGADVAETLASKGIEAVAAYCERDALATMQCYARLRAVL